MLGSVMMTEKTRVTTNHHATGGSLGRSTVRAQPATRTGWWIPVTAFVAWLVYRQVDAATAVEAALVGVGGVHRAPRLQRGPRRGASVVGRHLERRPHHR